MILCSAGKIRMSSRGQQYHLNLVHCRRVDPYPGSLSMWGGRGCLNSSLPYN